MKNRRFGAPFLRALLLPALVLGLAGCSQIYNYTSSNYAGRPTPPSGLQQRVLATYTTGGFTGGAEILDGLRDIRSNVQNTVPSFSIAGFSASQPIQILNFPEQTSGYIMSYTDGNLVGVNYSTEKSGGNVATFGAYPRSAAISPDGSRAAGASEIAGLLYVSGGGTNLPLVLPNVYKVAINRGNTIILAMVRNSNALYRVVKLNNTMTTVIPPGSVDCEPLTLPIYCVVPVAGTYDHPYDAVFSDDGNSVYVLDCGPECGGTTAGVTVLQTGALNVNNIPTVNPLTGPSPMQTLPVANPIPIPGGVTAAVSNGTTLYLSGQSTTDYTGVFTSTSARTTATTGLLTGYLTTLNLTTFVASASPVSISDGTHTRMLFADNSTLWIGSQQCANGKRAALATVELTSGSTDGSGNYNCLTRVSLASAAPTASIVPAITQGGSAPVTVAYPNTNQNPYYYGNLTGLCWVQNYGKVYTAYGGQIHAFNTADGSEINNTNITIQGTVLDVAYMDALTNEAN